MKKKNVCSLEGNVRTPRKKKKSKIAQKGLCFQGVMKEEKEPHMKRVCDGITLMTRSTRSSKVGASSVREGGEEQPPGSKKRVLPKNTRRVILSARGGGHSPGGKRAPVYSGKNPRCPKKGRGELSGRRDPPHPRTTYGGQYRVEPSGNTPEKEKRRKRKAYLSQGKTEKSGAAPGAGEEKRDYLCREFLYGGRGKGAGAQQAVQNRQRLGA